MRKAFDPTRINAIVLLTDGYDEVGGDPTREAVLTQAAGTPRVRVFTIAFGSGADVKTLQAISDASDAVCYDASNPRMLPDAFAAALANF
jgi:Ca-activated chloride channel family protein